MTPLPNPTPPPDADDRTAIRALAQALRSAGFATDQVHEVVVHPRDSGPTPLPVLVDRLDAGDPVATLASLFLHGVAVRIPEAQRALAPFGLDAALRLGIVEVHGDEVNALVRIGPFGPLLLASDRIDAPFRDYVMAGSGSSRTLANLTVRRPARNVLDVGTGTGVHALLAAATAQTVTATDLNPRALAFARFNAVLNGVDNVEFLEGPWFEPVAGRRFDLIVSNPPFVIAPEGEFLFRDGGEGGHGDAVSRMLVEATPEYLTDGGVAQFLMNWIHDRGGDWSLPIRNWVADTRCDAWLLHGSSDDPGDYAVRWNQHLSDQAQHAATIDHWLGWFEQAGIEAIGFGLLTLRRRDGECGFRADSLPEPAGPLAGAQLEAALDAYDELGRLTDPTDLFGTAPADELAAQSTP